MVRGRVVDHITRQQKSLIFFPVFVLHGNIAPRSELSKMLMLKTEDFTSRSLLCDNAPGLPFLPVLASIRIRIWILHFSSRLTYTGNRFFNIPREIQCMCGVWNSAASKTFAEEVRWSWRTLPNLTKIYRVRVLPCSLCAGCTGFQDCTLSFIYLFWMYSRTRLRKRAPSIV